MAEHQDIPSKKFGTFIGVYTPSVLTILGLIMYLRFGWVVGNVGLFYTIIIVLLSCSITFITGLSASAIATNIQVGVGGEYFLVSRSLGKETGGAIGIPLYFCRTLSVTFYCFGLAEAILVFWPTGWGELPGYAIQGVAAIFIIFVTLLSGKSAELTLKSQIPIMILVGLSIIALAIGVFSHELHSPIMERTYLTAEDGFWYVFAVFFPAVTGFTAGIGMSGDLRNPRKSIPRGTLGAVLTGAVVYLFIPILFATTGLLTLEELTNEEFGLKTWTNVALFGGILVLPAVWGALLSSAFGSILGGPRVAQALSLDGLAPKLLSKLSKTGQPRNATYISGGIALLAVLLGGLNTIAQLVSVLFLTLYVTINLSAAVEDIVKEPSYRPKIRIPWYISILGAIGAIGVMFLISPIACGVALIIVGGIYVYLRSRSLEQQWGDVSAGFWIKIARYALIQLNSRKIHSRNWRPLLITFVRDIDKRIDLIKLAQQFGQSHGILSVIKLYTESEDVQLAQRQELERKMTEKLDSYGFEAFCEAFVVKEIYRGFATIAMGHGMSGLRTNTVLFGLSESKEFQLKLLSALIELRRNEKNVILCNFNTPLPEQGETIDIWWGGKQNNGDLMLLLAYLLTLNTSWSKARIRILSMVESEEAKQRLTSGIQNLLPQARIEAKVEIFVGDKPFVQTLHLKSRKTDLVFLGLYDYGYDEVEKVSERITEMVSNLKIAVLIQNNGMIQSVPILLRMN
ncbi:MAG: amino acid permease [Flavobacteriaceae bacterium]|nr:amino acid permease [Flavobacteriaceae bacterium]